MADIPANKIKLLIIATSLQCGGSEKYVSMLCNNIDTTKFDVTLAIVNNANPFYTITNKAITVIDLNITHVRYALVKIKTLVKQYNPSIIYSTANHLNIYLVMFKRAFPKNIIFVARESSVVSINTKRSKFPWLYNGLIKKYYKRYDQIICQSVYMQHDLVENYNIKKNKTVVMHNPIEETLPQQVHEASAENKFITVARLSPEKGISRLIKAVSKLTIPFKYYIIGSGSEEKVLQKLIAELGMQHNIILTGQKKEPYRAMEDATFFLQGSYYEGFPNALAEAGEKGIPVIAFDAPGGTSEIVNDQKNGLLVKNNDETLFALTIQKALSIKFNRHQISADTRQLFTITTIIEATQQLFTQLYIRQHSNKPL